MPYIKQVEVDEAKGLLEKLYDDVAIHDATQVIGYFNYITRIADGLGVEPEDFIEPWGVTPG